MTSQSLCWRRKTRPSFNPPWISTQTQNLKTPKINFEIVQINLLWLTLHVTFEYFFLYFHRPLFQTAIRFNHLSFINFPSYQQAKPGWQIHSSETSFHCVDSGTACAHKDWNRDYGNLAHNSAQVPFFVLPWKKRKQAWSPKGANSWQFPHGTV